MKKKIKDLTFKEAQQIYNSIRCGIYPLNDLCQRSFDYDDEDLDKEIEVEE